MEQLIKFITPNKNSSYLITLLNKTLYGLNKM